MKNSEEPAYPIQPTFNSEGQICNERFAFEGLTKREYFAAKIAQGLCANPEICNHVNGWPDLGKIVSLTDALLTHLERK